MSTERRYTEEEIARILERATEVERTGGRVLGDPKGMTLRELQEIGQEVGIAPDLIADAAMALDRGGEPAVPTRRLLGTTIAVGRSVELDRRLTQAEWERLVVDLRETFDARGRIRQEGSFRQWTNGNLQALLEPTDSGERLRLRTLKGDATATLGLGAALMAIAPLLFVLLLVTGGMGDPDTVTLPALLALFGGALFGAGRLNLPRWAETRRLQMDGIAARLVEAVQEADRDAEASGGGTANRDA